MDLSYFNGIQTRDDLRLKMQDGIPEGYTKSSIEAVFKQVRQQGKEIADKELVEKNIDYKYQTQKYADINRIERKAFRESARVSNAFEAYNKELIEALKKQRCITLKHEELNTKTCGLIQLSDTHFNELIDIVGNRYDFNVASKRLKLLAIKSKIYFKALGINNILLALTGDLLNSNRRLDELLNQATNRANASVLAFFLLKQFILDLNQDFNIMIASVTGNESRIEKEHSYSEIIASDNFDSVIENMLKIQFMESKGITFATGSNKEKLINIVGQNIVLLHGDGSLTKNNTQTAVQLKFGAYAQKGTIIDYIIYGHVHCANVSNYSARSASLCGSNTYNEQELGLVGRASQNIYIFYDNKSRDGIVIDLQNVDDIEGYDIIKELQSYNAKSATKLHKNNVIFSVVI